MNREEAQESMRIRYKYRELILKKKIRLPLSKAARLIGPDCAYHLYASIGRSDAGEAR
jgi:hypothetical protein